MHRPSLFDLTDHLAQLSATGDPLEALECHVDFEVFRTVPVSALGYGDRPKGGRPPYGPVVMLKGLMQAGFTGSGAGVGTLLSAGLRTTVSEHLPNMPT